MSPPRADIDRTLPLGASAVAVALATLAVTTHGRTECFAFSSQIVLATMLAGDRYARGYTAEEEERSRSGLAPIWRG